VKLWRRASALGWVCCAAMVATSAPAATRSVQPGGLVTALRQAADGDTLELQAGDYHGEVGTITQKQLSLRGMGGRAVLHADGKSAEDKAILVVRDGDVTIDNIEFRGARVRDRNGAGIRFERGRLLVQRCAFFDNQNGILAGNVGTAELTIQDSEFGQAPANTPLPHLVYVGKIARFELTGSRVWGGQGGHLVKSRARLNVIRYNQLVDGAQGRAAYELEFPNGGLAYVVGNVIGQSAHTSNPVLVSFGAEADRSPDDREHGLFMAHNTLISEGLWPGFFVRVHALSRPVAKQFINNLSVGLGVGELSLTDASQGNFTVPRWMLQDADAGLFALPDSSWLKGRGRVPGIASGHAKNPAPHAPGATESLTPTAEFKLPLGTQVLKAPGQWSPGAYQY
jgi:hypothetical protein